MSANQSLTCRQLIDSTQRQLASLKRAREELLIRHLAQPKRPRRAQGLSTGSGDKSHWLPYERLQEIVQTRAFKPLTVETSHRIESEVAVEFCDAKIDRRVCLVTDAWVFRSNARQVSIDALPLAAMAKALAPRGWATSHIQAYYDCSSWDPRLAGMLLSPRGLERTENGNVQAWVSVDGLQTLQKLNEKLLAGAYVDDEPAPPRFAIADCFVAGTYDEIDSATMIERQAVGLVQTRGLIKVVYGGPGNVLQSHLLSWDNRHATIASRVPNVPSRSNFQVVLVGPFTSQQELALAKQHECDGDRVDRLQALMHRVNPLYRDVEVDREFRGVDESHRVFCTRLDGRSDDALGNDHDDTDGLVAQARARQQSVAVPQDADGTSVDETAVLQTETVIIETAADGEEGDRIARAVASLVGHPTYVVHRSTSILQSNDPFYMERMFPHLLTFGVGGFSSERRNRYSKRDIVLHYLDLSTNRFAEDPMFKMQMFDYLSTQRVRDGVFLRVKYDPSVASQAVQLTQEDLGEAMKARARTRHAARSERPVEHQSRGSRCASSVLKSIYASTSKMWGSNEEREAFQRKINAMTIMYGQPSVFWTLTPNPDSSIAVAFWADYDLPNGRPKDLVACSVVHLPDGTAMKRLTMQNTVLQAHYYKLCCRILIDTLFGWDSVADKPKADPGIFGFVEALFYALEQQGRLRVHHHGVLWVAGLPKTKSDWEAVLADNSMRARFEEYCKSIFAAELPVFDSVATLSCPTPSCSGELRPIDIHKKYKHQLKRGTPPPKVAACNVCKTEFTEAEIIEAVFEQQRSCMNADQRAASSNSAVDSLRTRFGGLSTDKATADVQLSRLLLKDQLHAFEHTHSCVKGRSGTKCRYRFFRNLENATRLTENGTMVFKRGIGNQWLNTYIPIWRRLLHFNMDARVLWDGDGLQVIRYAIQYASKRQTVLDNVAVVELAFKRRLQREAASQGNKTELQRGIGRLMSLAFSSSGVMEVGGPLATTILLEGAAAKFSCKFSRLVLLEPLNVMSNKDVEASVVAEGTAFVTETSVRQYTTRPHCLEQFSWYDYCAWIKARKGKVAGDSACTVICDSQQELSDHVRLHGLVRAEYPLVPEIIGPRMPDARVLEDEECNDDAELYFRMAVLLYCPFRDPKQFLDNSGSAKAYFESWNPLADPKLRRSLDYHQQFYLSLDAASEFRARQAEDDPDSSCDDNDVQHSRHGAVAGDSERVNSLVAVSSDMYGCAEDVYETTGNEVADLQRAVEDSAMRRLLANNVLGEARQDDSRCSGTIHPTAISKAELDVFEMQLGAEPILQPASSARPVPPTAEITVELLNAAVDDVRFDDTTMAETEVSQVASGVTAFASVQEVSRAFHLNEEQHLAFTLIAVPMLHKIAGVNVPEHSSFSSSSPLIVTGAGGTGKTRIVDAVRCLARSWGRQKAVMATASTGIAAVNLGGHTMHSSVGLGINQTHLPKHLERPSDELLAQWDPVCCVVADELSMTDIGFFGLWEEALQKVKDCQKPFGGLVAVLMFDFCQLSTVRGTQLFKIADPRKPFKAIQARGSLLYRSIRTVVYLTRNMRFSDDSEWGDWLAKARVGEWCEDMRAFLRQVSPPPSDALTGQFIQVVSTDNATRQHINDTAMQIATQTLATDRKVFAFPAMLPKGVASTDMAKIQNLTDSQTGNMAVFLKVYVGMPTRVKANQCIPKGVANGADGGIFHIDWHENTTFTLKNDGVWVASRPPANIYVNLHNSQVGVRFPGLPATWPPSVMPILQSRSTFKLQKRTLSIKGFPLVPAFGTTVHGVQGNTRDEIVVTDLRPPHFRRVDRHALYVALSRVRTRTGLYWLGRKLDDSDFEFFQPSQDVLEEDRRLHVLAAETAVRSRL